MNEAVVLEAKRRMSMFQTIKQNGLRSIEDALFEYKVRIKNCNDEDEAMYILRMLNANSAILEDYIDNTPNLSESEVERWKSVLQEYRKLRFELGSKKFTKQTTFIGIDYNMLDNLDRQTGRINTPGAI